MSIVRQKSEFNKAFAKFDAVLMGEIERLAKLVIESGEAESFCMAMGSTSFHCMWTEYDDEDPTDTWERDENLNPVELENIHAKEIDKLLCEWNAMFCLTGSPMLITRDLVTGELITTDDW